MLKVIFFVIIILGSIVLIRLFIHKKKISYFSVYVLSLVLISLNQLLAFENDFLSVFPIYNAILGYILAPLLYFHFLSLLPIKGLNRIAKMHFWVNSPVLLFITIWIFDDFRRKLLVLNTNSLITAVTFIESLFYLWLYVKIMKAHKEEIKDIKLTTQYQRILWSKYIFISFLIMVVIITLENFYVENKYSNLLVYIIFCIILIQISAFLAKILKEKSFFSESSKSTLTFNMRNEFLLTNEDEKSIHKRINILINEKKIFKNPNISLISFSDELEVSTHNLSKFINSKYDQSFKDFINSARLKETKLLLKKSENSDRRVNEIMYEVGFKSKSVFNTLFKKHFGVTPSEFKKQ